MRVGSTSPVPSEHPQTPQHHQTQAFPDIFSSPLLATQTSVHLQETETPIKQPVVPTASSPLSPIRFKSKEAKTPPMSNLSKRSSQARKENRVELGFNSVAIPFNHITSRDPSKVNNSIKHSIPS